MNDTIDTGNKTAISDPTVFTSPPTSLAHAEEVPLVREPDAMAGVASLDSYGNRRPYSPYMGDVKLEQAALNTGQNNNTSNVSAARPALLSMPYLDARPALRNNPALQSFSNTLQANGGATKADVEWVTQLRLDLRQDAQGKRQILHSPDAPHEAKVQAVQSLKGDRQQFREIRKVTFAS